MEPSRHLIGHVHTLSATLRERDAHTADHGDRTCALALALGQLCSLQLTELSTLRLAASVHDVGKIGIPDRILRKPGKLETDEWAVMQTHPERGYRILMTIDAQGTADLAHGVRHHHESFDGTGYPDGLAGESIPILSRILALADSYDAMATTRSYHRPRSHDEIMRVLHEEDAGKYDPYLRTMFGKCLESSSLRA